jgi:hypothetical protein
MLEVSFTVDAETGQPQSTLQLVVDLEPWEGCNLNELPYFSKFLNLYSRIVDGWELSIKLEVKGDVLLSAGSKFDKQLQQLRFMYGFMMYTKMARGISVELQYPVVFTKKIILSDSDLQDVCDVFETLEGRGDIFSTDFLKSAKIEIPYDGSRNQIEVFEKSQDASFSVSETKSRSIHLFGQILLLPIQTIYFSGVTILVKNKDMTLVEGDALILALVPRPDFSCKKTFSL